RYVDNPQVKLAGLGQRNNYAQVIVEADVSGDLRYYKNVLGGEEFGGSLEFQVDDGTDVMKIRCYDEATSELIRERKLPAQGDRITVRGTFQSRGKTRSIILGSAYGISISRSRPGQIMTWNEISGLTQNAGVLTEGRVLSAKYNRYRMEFIIDDGAGNTAIAYIPGSILDALGIPEENRIWEGMPQAGDLVRVSGIAVIERGRDPGFSIALALPEDIRKVQ
ncbi:MAG: hypothetical protein PHQ23_13690, partial [Candidatus Wallbacteria bacterium]|nr:hypothetical protein [Candidatus Wallbacteria bacterium]